VSEPQAKTTTVVVPTKWFAKAAGLTRTASMMTASEGAVLDHTYVRIYQDHVRLTSTDEVTAVDVEVPVSEDADDAQLAGLNENPISFLVKSGSLTSLVSQEDGENFTFTVDLENHSLISKVHSSDLTLPTRSGSEWPNIDDRFEMIDGTSEEQEVEAKTISKKTLQAMLEYNSFFLSTGQDPALNLIEIRGGQAISSDRVKFGYFTHAELGDVSLKLPGDNISSISKAVSFFPDDQPVTINLSEHYNLFQVETKNNFKATFGFTKCTATVPNTLDKIPVLEEPEQVYVDRAYLAKAANRLEIVCPKKDPRIKITISGKGTKAKMSLTVLNELGQPSYDMIPVNRIKAENDSAEASVIMPLDVLQKALRLSEAPNVVQKIQPGKYLKVVSEESGVATYSIFQALQTLQA
jgi:DNA polymerase III sliding clamp (beta) subunit (PCNA family)